MQLMKAHFLSKVLLTMEQDLMHSSGLEILHVHHPKVTLFLIPKNTVVGELTLALNTKT